MALLSVVVPCFNIELYVTACLESLRRQTNPDFEVIVVDDGATDSTPDLIKEFCSSDDRFRYVGQENQGLGAGRNNGSRVATGEYLAFVDGDDVLHPQAYERLLGSLASTGSDFAICGAGRFNRLGTSSSYTHLRAVTGSRSRTHISRQPELVLDRMAWNKVYRRDFWDRENLEFPRTPMGEDFPVSVEAHVKAAAVDVLNEALYFWRERDGGEASLTQSSSDLRRLHGRFETSMVAWELATAGAPGSLPLLREYLLDVDVTAIVAALCVNPPENHPEILGLAREMAARVGGASDPTRTPFQRVQAALLDRGDVEGLIELHRWRELRGPKAPLGRIGRLRPQLVERLPGLGGGSAPREAYLVEDGRALISAGVVDASWNGPVLELAIHVEVPDFVGSRALFRVWAESTGGSVAECVVERVPSGPTAKTVVELKASLDPALVEKSRNRGRGRWDFRIQVDDKSAGPAQALDGPTSGRERFLGTRMDSNVGNLVIRPFMGTTGFAFVVGLQTAAATSCHVVGDEVEVSGTVQHLNGVEELQFGLTGPDGTELEFETEASSGEDGWTFRVRIPGALLADTPNYRSPLATRRTFAPWLDTGAARVGLTLDPGLRSCSVVVGHRTVTFTRSMAATFQVVENRTAPEVTAITWTDAGTLRFEGIWLGRGALPTEILLGHYDDPGGAIEHRIVLEHDEDRYAYEVDISELGAGPAPRIWHQVMSIDGPDLPQVFDRDKVATFPAPRSVAGVRVAVVLARDDLVRIAVGG